MSFARITARLLAAALLGATLQAQAWEPARDASARQILQDAHKDAAEGRLEQAAQKHLWFHEHVLAREPAMSGVRLSFALASWAALAQRHPPAMQQLLAVRDREAARVDAGGLPGLNALNEVISINRYLRQPESTRDAFARFALRDPDLAEREALDALPALIAHNDYELAGRHLRVEAVLPRMESLYKVLQEVPPNTPDDRRAELLRSSQRFTEIRLARVVVVLVKNQRDAEAEQVVARGRALLGRDTSTHHMNQALRGVAPPDDYGG